MTDYKKLRELAEKATPGPWTQVDTPWGDGTWVCTGTGDPHGQMPVADCEMHCHEDEYESEPRVHENAAFIAALSPSTVIQLLNEVERLREDVRQARAITQAERLDHISTLGQAAELERQLSSTRQRLAAVEQGAEQVITAENITDEMIAAIRDAACECRPRRPIESDNHCASHDCDVSTYDVCVTALEAVNEEADTARVQCAAEANDILQNHGPASAYWRALTPLISKRAGKGGAVMLQCSHVNNLGKQCCYVKGHSGACLMPTGSEDLSDEIRLKLLRDNYDALTTDRDSLRLRIAELEKERDEAIGTNLAGLVADLRKTRADRDDADDAAWRRLLKVDELEAELDRYRPVVEAAKAWREAEIVEQGLRATTGWTTESRSLIGRTHAALIAAIDSLSTKGPTNE